MNEPDPAPESAEDGDFSPTLPFAGREGELNGLDPKALIAGGLEPQTVRPGWQPPTPEELSRLLPQYEIDAFLGRGGMGAVYRGRQVALDRRVAIKLLPAEMAADPEFVARFQREARTLAKLHHPGIVLVHDFGQTGEGHLYFVMEFVDGTDLHKIIHGPGLECAQALEIIGQICDALQYAHGQGVVHRDIKPANILLTLDGRAKLGDFGLARPIEDGSGAFTRSNVVMGTPDYMAPEALAGEADHRADLYSLGVMLYEMLTGRPPRGAWAPPSQRVQVDVRLDQVVLRALQEDPELRYQQASEIKTDVEVIRSGEAPKLEKAKAAKAHAAPGQRTAALQKGKKTVNKSVCAAVIVVVMLAVGAWWFSVSMSNTDSGLPWQKAQFAYDYKIVAPGPDGWQKTGLNDKILHLYLSAPDGNYHRLRNSAIRFRMRWAEDNGGPLSLFPRYSTDKQQPEGFIEYQLNKDRLVIRKNGSQIQETNLENPIATGDEAVIETVSLEDDFFFRVNGQVIKFAGAQMRQEGWVIIGGWKAQFKNAEYLDLDGIPDPLKALGWEVPVDAPNLIPWTRVERTANEWAKTGQTLQTDGWVRNSDKTFPLFDRLSESQATSKFAIRTRVKFHDKEACLAFANQTGGGHTWRRVQIWPNKLTAHNGDKSSPEPRRHVASVDPDEESFVEVLVDGSRVHVRFNGEPMFTGDFDPVIPWETCYLIGGLDYSLRDIEYAILDDVTDPLKALRWEVSVPGDGKSKVWRDFLAELTDRPHKNAQLGQVWAPEGSLWRVKNYHVFMIPDQESRDLAIRATGTGSLGVFVRDNGTSGYAGRLFDSVGRARIQLNEEILREYRIARDEEGSKMSTIELRAVGDTLTLLVDDVELGTVQDSTLGAGGLFGVTAGEGSLIEKVEYRILDSN